MVFGSRSSRDRHGSDQLELEEQDNYSLGGGDPSCGRVNRCNEEFSVHKINSNSVRVGSFVQDTTCPLGRLRF